MGEMYMWIYIRVCSNSLQHLNINITKRTRHGIHRIRNRNPWRVNPECNNILQRPIPTRGRIIQRNRPANRIPPILNILTLPYPPRAIDLSMMEPEHRVPGAGEDVSAGVATEREMPASVDAVEARGEIALHEGLEPVYVRIGVY
jgi:hypothetical protein